jgi:beta-glucosidase
MKSIENRVETLLAQMTLDEKLAQAGSCWFYELQSAGALDAHKIAARLEHGIGQISRVAGASTLPPRAAAQAGNQIQKFLVQQTRLGIPAILHEECCSGAMVLGGSMYPQMLGLAATFQPELAQAMSTAIRKQLLAIGARQGLAPVLDIARDPRWGRVEETFGEDPTLAAAFGVAYIKGLQGDDLRQGVLATGKHFIGHSASLGGLNCGPVQIGASELYNTYMAPFQAAISQAGLASMMNAYPDLDGELVAASRRILTGLLREQLGFDGLVVSDYDALIMIHNYHAVAENPAQAAKLGLEAGIDVELPTVACYGQALKAALAAGDVALETLDLAVRRHLQKKFELGLFEEPFVDEGRVLEVFETAENRALARQIARQSMVLLKNDGLLPLRKEIASIAVIGPNAHDGRSQLGDYSYAATRELMEFTAPANSSFSKVSAAALAPDDIQIGTLLEAIRAAVSPETRVLYAQGCSHQGSDRRGFEEAMEVARFCDVVVLALGDRSGLTPNCTSGETRDSADLRLQGMQEDLAKALIESGAQVAAVLFTGRPLALPWLEAGANAILEAWLPGEEGGQAVTELLFGDANPGGKLPVSFPRSAGQTPVYYNHKASGMRSNWYVDYVSEKVTPLYPFGHGLSYTQFEYRDLRLSSARATQGETIDISLTVANCGKLAGEEVVQLYLRDEYASSPRPVKELKGYLRLALEPGERKEVSFHLPVDQLAFYNTKLELVLEPGRFQVMVGSSSQDIRLQSAFDVHGRGSMLVKERIFACPVDVQPAPAAELV